MNKYCIYLLLVSLLLCYPATIVANTPVSAIQVKPAIHQVTLETEGEEERFEIMYSNNTKESITLELSTQDYTQENTTGKVIFSPHTDSTPNSVLNTYLAVNVPTLQIAPTEKKKVIVTVTNSSSLSPGGHYVAIVGKIGQATEKENGTTLSPYISTLLLVRKVGGEHFNLSFKDSDQPNNAVLFSYPEKITLSFQNNGNIHLFPYGRVEVTDTFGRLIYKGVINTSSLPVFPNKQRDILGTMHKVAQSFPVSYNTLTVQGDDSLHKVTYGYKKHFVYIHPVVVLAVFGLVVIGVLLVIKKRKK